jgi:cytochrome P450
VPHTLPEMNGSMVLRTLRFTLNPDGFFADAHRRYGDMFTMRVLGQRWVALAHPDAVRDLLS